MAGPLKCPGAGRPVGERPAPAGIAARKERGKEQELSRSPDPDRVRAVDQAEALAAAGAGARRIAAALAPLGAASAARAVLTALERRALRRGGPEDLRPFLAARALAQLCRAGEVEPWPFVDPALAWLDREPVAGLHPEWLERAPLPTGEGVYVGGLERVLEAPDLQSAGEVVARILSVLPGLEPFHELLLLAAAADARPQSRLLEGVVAGVESVEGLSWTASRDVLFRLVQAAHAAAPRAARDGGEHGGAVRGAAEAFRRPGARTDPRGEDGLIAIPTEELLATMRAAALRECAAAGEGGGERRGRAAPPDGRSAAEPRPDGAGAAPSPGGARVDALLLLLSATGAARLCRLRGPALRRVLVRTSLASAELSRWLPEPAASRGGPEPAASRRDPGTAPGAGPPPAPSRANDASPRAPSRANDASPPAPSRADAAPPPAASRAIAGPPPAPSRAQAAPSPPIAVPPAAILAGVQALRFGRTEPLRLLAAALRLPDPGEREELIRIAASLAPREPDLSPGGPPDHSSGAEPGPDDA